MDIKIGNVLDVESGAICQQVNCKGKMNAGLAKEIRKKWPVVYESYMEFENKQLGVVLPVRVDSNLFVYNLFGQDEYGRNKMYTHYEALGDCLKLSSMMAEADKLQLHIPYNLGCGLAGGDWNVVSKLIEQYCQNAVVWKLI